MGFFFKMWDKHAFYTLGSVFVVFHLSFLSHAQTDGSFVSF